MSLMEKDLISSSQERALCTNWNDLMEHEKKLFCVSQSALKSDHQDCVLSLNGWKIYTDKQYIIMLLWVLF